MRHGPSRAEWKARRSFLWKKVEKNSATEKEIEELNSIPVAPADLGIRNAAVFWENLHTLVRLSDAAKLNGHYFEYIAIAMLRMDHSLRMYLALNDKHELSAKADASFSELLSAAKLAGMNAELYADAREFNRRRNHAFHRLLLGDLKYEELLTEIQGLESVINGMIRLGYLEAMIIEE